MFGLCFYLFLSSAENRNVKPIPDLQGQYGLISLVFANHICCKNV